MRYISAFRFQSRMLASPTDPPAPMVLRKLSICVPPMEDTSTTFSTPALAAASICAFCPSQSTASGEPPSGKKNCGRRFSMNGSSLETSASAIEASRGLGTAEVRITSASRPAHRSARAFSSEMSPWTNSTGRSPRAFRSLSADLLERTRPLGGAKEALSARRLTTSEPVRPPAPATATFIPPASPAKTPGEARVFVGTKTPRRAVASLPPLMRAALPSARASIEGRAATDATTMVDARRARRSPVRVSWSGRIEIEPTILVTTDKTFASLHCDRRRICHRKKRARRRSARRRSGARRERPPPNRDAHSTAFLSWA